MPVAPAYRRGLGSWQAVCTWAPGSPRKSVPRTFLGVVTLWGSHMSPGWRMDKLPLFMVLRTTFYSCDVLSCVPGGHHRNIHSSYVHVCLVWQHARGCFHTWGRVHRCPEAGRLLWHPKQQLSRGRGSEGYAAHGPWYSSCLPHVTENRFCGRHWYKVVFEGVSGESGVLCSHLSHAHPAPSVHAPAGWEPRPPPPH